MSTQAISTPYEWIRKIPSYLATFDTVPQLGTPPDFSWDQFSQKLSQTLNLQDLIIHPASFEWREGKNLLAGLGSPLIPIAVAVPPFEGLLYWAMPRDEALELLSLICFREEEKGAFSKDSFLEGFYSFLALEVIHTIESLGIYPEINAQLMDSAELPSEAMLCSDISIKTQNITKVGRLLLSEKLRKSFSEHYREKSQKALLKSPLSEKLDVILHLEAGSATLSQKEWKEVKPGDFLVLDRCELTPGSSQEKVMMTYQGSPFFKAKIKDGNIEILEHPLYHEVNETMSTVKGKDFEEKEEENEEEYEDEESEEEEDDYEEEEEGDDDDDYEEEESGEEEEEEEDDDGDKEESEEKSGGKEEEKTADVEKDSQIIDKAKVHPVAEQEEKRIASPQDIPLNVVIEVGRVQMSVKTLMELAPGNLLELNVRPEAGVDLVVNGSRIGKGELLQIGETLGVRILELG